MNHRQALEFLHARGNELRSMRLGLDPIRRLLAGLGDPQRRYPALHVAGTNGKGSVAAVAESILREAGWRTGLYTSPHLVRVEERIRVAGRAVGPSRLARLLTRVRAVETRLLRRRAMPRPATYFELLTACGLLHFADAGVDVAVVEVGIGGRLDATNTVEPACSVITTIAYDHRDLLGRTLAAIAREKAGILRAGVPVVSGCRAPAARRVIRARARAVGAPLVEIDRDCTLAVDGERRGRFAFDLDTPRRRYRGLRSALAGEHQARNAAIAIAAVEALPRFPAADAPVRRGLRAARWPGRLDLYRGPRPTLLDGAHNVEGAGALRRYLDAMRPPEVHLVFGAMRDKEIGAMAAALFPLARAVHVARPASPRAATASEIAAAAPRFAARLRAHPSPAAALEAAWRESPPWAWIVVTGSLYLVGELLELVRTRSRLPSTSRTTSA